MEPTYISFQIKAIKKPLKLFKSVMIYQVCRSTLASKLDAWQRRCRVLEGITYHRNLGSPLHLIRAAAWALIVYQTTHSDRGKINRSLPNKQKRAKPKKNWPAYERKWWSPNSRTVTKKWISHPWVSETVLSRHQAASCSQPKEISRPSQTFPDPDSRKESSPK